MLPTLRSAQHGLFDVSWSRMAFGSAISWPFFVQISSKIVNFVFRPKCKISRFRSFFVQNEFLVSLMSINLPPYSTYTQFLLHTYCTSWDIVWRKKALLIITHLSSGCYSTAPHAVVLTLMREHCYCVYAVLVDVLMHAVDLHKTASR